VNEVHIIVEVVVVMYKIEQQKSGLKAPKLCRERWKWMRIERLNAGHINTHYYYYYLRVS